ncbi:MAG TPA: hypothetical protein VGW34_07780 [Allosphingosinicella sp.]|nr:hypothetical protein [Allosphingosinicella sp.]
MTMSEDRNETERMGRAMAASARGRPEFIGAAMALWEQANPGQSAAEMLRCNEDQAWRLAITPRPMGATMVRQAMEVATELGANPTALVNLLRFADSAAAFAGANDDGEMLMAALDAEATEEDDH